MLAIAVLLLAFQRAPSAAAPGARDTLASAYLDAGARDLVRAARERRERVDRSVTAYRALGKERASVGVRALSRERMLFRRELAARIHWRREGPLEVEVLGARQVVPVAVPRPHLPGNLGSEVADLVFDPADEQLFVWSGGDSGEADDDDFFRHPLAPGSEADYRFRSGGVAEIRLPGGRAVRLRELQVLPRRDDARLLRGSLWLDAGSHAVVRALFQMSRPLDLERDLDEGEDIPGVLRPVRAELRYITIEYGLWQGHWWMPRLIALDLVVDMGSKLGIPVRFERAYEEYEVEGDTAAAPLPRAALPPADTASTVTVRCSGERPCSCQHGRCREVAVRLPADSAALLTSDALPPSIYSQGEGLITEGELRRLADQLGMAAPGGMEGWRPVSLGWSYLTPALVRYNRVEGLALGARAEAAFAGPRSADATLWLGLADREPNAEIGLEQRSLTASRRLAAYRRLQPVDPGTRALGLGNSLAALLLGRDEGEYYRALGVELRGESLARRGWGAAWRLFAERQSAAEKGTDFSLPHLLDAERDFAPNLRAAAADQLGAELSLGVRRGLDPVGVRWGAELSTLASAGDYRFVRPALSTFLGVPLPGSLVGALTLSGGTAFGEMPVQDHWFLGGPSTVRGYGAASRASGDAFWRGRAEVGTDFPAARLVLFSDAGWAGPRADFQARPALLSAGAGASFLDGLVRLDLARALRGRTGWRMDLYLDGTL